MATNTTATSQTHNGNGSTTTFAISFSFLENTEVDVTVGGVLKTLGTHYNISSSSVVFTSGNIPPSGTANIKFQRDTDISTKKVDFSDGSVLTETDLDNNSDQILFAQQEITNKLGGIEEGATADQTDAEIRAAVEAATDSNVFTDADHTKLNGIETAATADQTDAEIRTAVENASDSNVFTDADHSKLNGIEAGATADQTITEIKSLIAGSPLDASHLAANSVASSEIADNAVLNAKLADAELRTLAGMQSATASKLADSTALTSDIADLNQLDGLTKQTTISDSDASFPTSGAVVDYVAAQIAPIGGLELIATDAAFPNTQPAAGVVISIADAGGLVVDANGTSTTARTVGGSTVTINNFASNFNNSTIDAGVAMMVSSTGAGNIYNYHKATLKEADLLSLSNDINDFAARYRVTAGEPTSNNDEGDLIYDKNADKMKVFDSTTNAFKEVTSVGDYKFLFLCPTGGSGAPTINGSIATYDLREGSNTGTAATVISAAQLTVSINGVIQKPNTGTSAPSEGFAMVDSNTIIFGTNLPTGAEIFIIQIGTATSLNVPTDNSVSTNKLQSGSVNNAKVATDAAIDSTKLSFTQAGAGANARTVDSKLKEILHFKDFGAVGDGSTDDATALLEAFNAATGKVLDGGGLTYKCNSMLAPTSQNIVVQNATFDFSGVTTTGNSANGYISFTGAAGTPTAVSANVNVGDNTFTVASTTGLTTPNSWHILEDDQVINSGESLTLGQYIFVKEVNTTSKLVTLHNDVLYKFLSASNAQVVPITMKKNITFKNVIIKGANPAGTTTNNGHTGLRFRRCEGVTIENCTLEDVDYAGSVIDACVNVKISNTTCKHHTKAGLSYGFVIGNASYAVNVVNCYAQDLRHFVTIGDNEGMNLFVNVTNCHITGCRDSGIDSHAGGDFVNFSGNTVEGSSFDSGNLDGIICQGFNSIMNDNIVVGIRRHAIFHQVTSNLAADSGGTGSTIISGNHIINHGGASSAEAGILVTNLNNVLGEIKGVTIANNKLEGESNYGIYVQANGGAISNIAITGNSVNVSDTAGILVRSYTNNPASLITITGNIVEVTGGTNPEGIDLQGVNGGTQVSTATITGNVIDMNNVSGSSGVRLYNANHVMVSSNVIKDAPTLINPSTTTNFNNVDNVYVNNIDHS